MSNDNVTKTGPNNGPDSFDGSESREDINKYLSDFFLSCSELEEESCILTGGADRV